MASGADGPIATVKRAHPIKPEFGDVHVQKASNVHFHHWKKRKSVPSHRADQHVYGVNGAAGPTVAKHVGQMENNFDLEYRMTILSMIPVRATVSKNDHVTRLEFIVYHEAIPKYKSRCPPVVY